MAQICAGLGLRSLALVLATTICVVSCGEFARAAEARAKPARVKADAKTSAVKSPAVKTPATSVEMFAGIQSGELEVKLIAMDSTKGNVMIRNKTQQPISVRLPKAFAGVPVLAQFRGAMQGNNNFSTNGGRNANGANQAMGGGFGQGLTGLQGNGMNMNMNGPNGGVMNIPPEKTAKVRVPLVCLEHGKADPRATIPYAIKPLDSVTKDVAVQQLCTMLGEGKVRQRIAQVAAWHLANGLSYEDLAAKELEEFGSPARPYFTSQEMEDAVAIVTQAEDRAADIAKDSKQSVDDKATSGTTSATMRSAGDAQPSAAANANVAENAVAAFGEAVSADAGSSGAASLSVPTVAADRPALRRKSRAK